MFPKCKDGLPRAMLSPARSRLRRIAAMPTGLVFHELYLWHDTGHYSSVFQPGLTIEPGEHAENPATKRRLRNLLEVSGLLDRLTPVKAWPASEDDLARFHTRDYIERLKALSAERGGEAGYHSPFGPGSFEIASLSAGGVMAAIDAVIEGRVGQCYALVRPPGHHAEADRGLGFCLFANVALAIMHARAVHGIGRVAAVDWDVHHGNGTQAAFYEEPHVLTLSLHQDRLFPVKGGGVDERGAGKGLGANINVPLPAGCADAAYAYAFERVVEPALRRFRPELIVVPCGFDAGGVDPLGRMMLTSEAYRLMTRRLMALAEEFCGGRLVFAHEGGYAASHVPYCGLAVLEELAGRATGVADPWLAIMQRWGGIELQPHQVAAIDRAAEAAGLGG
jgi:acetoin utilization deacetylase AcuC-like enzyme